MNIEGKRKELITVRKKTFKITCILKRNFLMKHIINKKKSIEQKLARLTACSAACDDL